MRNITSIERLESRIAPALVIGASGKFATFNDVDGDLVTVTVSKGHLDPADFTLTPAGLGFRLTLLNFADDNLEFAGANLSITAKPLGSLGDGFVNVGFVDNLGASLGRVFVDGDLTGLRTGAINATKPSLGSLDVQSIDMVQSGLVIVQGGAGSIKVHGGIGSGSIVFSGHVGSFSAGGSLFGGTTSNSGLIILPDIGIFRLGGSILGGSGAGSGNVEIGHAGAVSIGGAVFGGIGADSGQLSITDGFSRVSIGGTVRGGSGASSGLVDISVNQAPPGVAPAVKLVGGLVGGDADGAGTVSIKSSDTLRLSVTLTNGILGGEADNTGDLLWGARGSLRVTGGIHGGIGDLSGAIHSSDPLFAEKNTIDRLQIVGAITGGFGKNSGGVFAGTIGSGNVGGGISGGQGENSGFLRAAIGHSLSINGDVRGLAGKSSGDVIVTSGDNITLKLSGSVVGGSGQSSGGVRLSQADANLVQVGGSVLGGTQQGSGFIDLGVGTIDTLTIRGSIVGGNASQSGLVEANDVGVFLLAGNIIGGDATPLSDVINPTTTGVVDFGTVKSAVIGGSIIAGTDYTKMNNLDESGWVIIEDHLDSVTVRGSVQGSLTNRAAIVFGQSSNIDSPSGKITIGGDVHRGDILGGYDFNGNASTADVGLGALIVGGNWIESNFALGTTAGADSSFGTNDDQLIPGGDANVIARVASIVIKGQALGDGLIAPGGYGFSAEKIDSLTVGSFHPSLSGSADTFLVGSSLDLSVHDMK